MNKRNIRAFIARLKLARAAVERGDTGCSTWPDRCWHCAMTKRSSRDRDTRFWSFTGPSMNWPMKHTRDEALAMFDNSIAALERTLNEECNDGHEAR